MFINCSFVIQPYIYFFCGLLPKDEVTLWLQPREKRVEQEPFCWDKWNTEPGWMENLEDKKQGQVKNLSRWLLLFCAGLTAPLRRPRCSRCCEGPPGLAVCAGGCHSLVFLQAWCSPAVLPVEVVARRAGCWGPWSGQRVVPRAGSHAVRGCAGAPALSCKVKCILLLSQRTSPSDTSSVTFHPCRVL